MKDNEIIEGYWWCKRCQSTKSPCQVTYEESCTACGSQVEWREDSEALMPTDNPTLDKMTVAIARAMGIPIDNDGLPIRLNEHDEPQVFHPATSRDDLWLVLAWCHNNGMFRCVATLLFADIALGSSNPVVIVEYVLRATHSEILTACYRAMVAAGKIEETTR